MPNKVSVIIPARNEEKYLAKTIAKYRQQDYPVEIVVVVNDSTDKTLEMARRLADKALDFPERIGVCQARNEGAKVATGEVFIFSDADSYLSEGGVCLASQLPENVIGVPLGRPEGHSIKGSILFFCKNWIHRLKIYEGVIDGILFCRRGVFEKNGGFDNNKTVGEFEDFIGRARARGVMYKLFTRCRAITSLRRYEGKGYLFVFFFWVWWRILFLFKKGDRFSKTYFK